MKKKYPHPKWFTVVGLYGNGDLTMDHLRAGSAKEANHNTVRGQTAEWQVLTVLPGMVKECPEFDLDQDDVSRTLPLQNQISY